MKYDILNEMTVILEIPSGDCNEGTYNNNMRFKATEHLPYYKVFKTFGHRYSLHNESKTDDNIA